VFGTPKWDLPPAWERAVERAKLVDFHFHDPRHTFASCAVQRGASLQEVKDLLGPPFAGDATPLRSPGA
jgi:integrase